MSLVRALRAKGHDVRLDAADLTVMVVVGPGGDETKAGEWALTHEQELRRELVTELQAIVGIRAVFSDSRLVKVRGSDGAEITGRVRVERRPESGPG